MPKSRKSQPAKKPRTEAPPPAELEDAIAPELAEGETPAGTPTPSTYVVSEADTASGASSPGRSPATLLEAEQPISDVGWTSSIGKPS